MSVIYTLYVPIQLSQLFLIIYLKGTFTGELYRSANFRLRLDLLLNLYIPVYSIHFSHFKIQFIVDTRFKLHSVCWWQNHRAFCFENKNHSRSKKVYHEVTEDEHIIQRLKRVTIRVVTILQVKENILSTLRRQDTAIIYKNISILILYGYL